MRIWHTLALVIGIAAVGVEAQTRDRFVVFAHPFANQPAILYKVDTTGAVTSTIATLPAGFRPKSIVMAEDNVSLRAIGSFPSLQSGAIGAIFDIDASGSVTSFFVGSPLVQPSDMVRTSDGDWLVLNRPIWPNQTEVLRIRGKTAAYLSTIWRFVGHGIAIDETTGQLVVGSHWGIPMVPGYFRLDPNSGVITTFSLYPTSSASMDLAARRPWFDGSTGDFIDMTPTMLSSTSLVRARRGQPVQLISSQLLAGFPLAMSDAGQRSGADHHVLVMSHSSPPRYDIVGARSDGTWLGKASITQIAPAPNTTLLRVGGRQLTWFMNTPPNGRSLRLSFPGEAGRTYAVGLSATGTRPGIPLGDGRVVPLVFDAFTLLCAQGGIPGVLENTFGVLDTRGSATVKVDTNQLGSAVRGLVLWAVALVMDPQAPSGVAWIVGPCRIEMR